MPYPWTWIQLFIQLTENSYGNDWRDTAWLKNTNQQSNTFIATTNDNWMLTVSFVSLELSKRAPHRRSPDFTIGNVFEKLVDMSNFCNGTEQLTWNQPVTLDFLVRTRSQFLWISWKLDWLNKKCIKYQQSIQYFIRIGELVPTPRLRN